MGAIGEPFAHGFGCDSDPIEVARAPQMLGTTCRVRHNLSVGDPNWHTPHEVGLSNQADTPVSLWCASRGITHQNMGGRRGSTVRQGALYARRTTGGGMIRPAIPQIGDREYAAVERVLRSGNLSQGSEVGAFEDEFSCLAVDGATCVAVNSGTSALHLSLIAAGVGPNDEVLVPSFTFAATANAVALTGATPVFVDIEANTFCMSVSAAREVVTERTKAIMPVHLYGHPADLPGFSALCEEFGLILIEDASQAHLASVDGRPVGTWGLAGSFSFYPTKNMTAGEGGIVSTNDADLARTVRLLRNQGQERKYHNEIVGFNNRMTDIHAAIGRVQLSRLVGWTKQRQANAAFFDQSLRGVVTPVVAPGAVHVYHQYTIRVVDQDRDKFAERLAEHGVGTGVYYPVPNHRLPAYNRNLNLPETERATHEVLSLPIHPSLTQDELVQIVDSVNAVAAAGVGSG